jgi:AcrR family transcriptional regulator
MNPSHHEPGKLHPTACEILDAAEELFCGRGFAAVSMRDIATASGHPLASAHYHFGSKSRLFEAVFLRRIVPVNARRLALLRALERRGGAELEEIVEAYLRPLFEEESDKTVPGRKSRLIMMFSKQLLSNPEEHDYLLEYYGETARAFIEALTAALPRGSREAALRGYDYLVAIVVMTLAGRARAARIPADLLLHDVGSEATEATIDRLGRFVAAGIRAIDARA